MRLVALLVFAVSLEYGVVAAQAETATPTAKEIRGVTPYIEIKNEPPPKLIVDPPLPEGLANPVVGIFWAQYRVERGKPALRHASAYPA
jgi:hypothetical protein